MNDIITYEVLHYLKVFMQRDRDIFSTNSEVFNTDNELATEGKKHETFEYQWLHYLLLDKYLQFHKPQAIYAQ
jgi:hypothetical protein